MRPRAALVTYPWWYWPLMIRVIFADQMLRHTRWNSDARPYYPPSEISDEL